MLHTIAARGAQATGGARHYHVCQRPRPAPSGLAARASYPDGCWFGQAVKG